MLSALCYMCTLVGCDDKHVTRPLPCRYDYLAHIVSRIREETVAMDVAKRGGVAPPSTDDLGIVVALSAGEMPQDVMQVGDMGYRV